MSTQTAKTRFASPGGGSGGITVDQAGVPVVPAATILNFVGATVTPGGPGQANVTIAPGGTPIAPEYHTLTGPELVAGTFLLSSAPTIYFADIVGGSTIQPGLLNDFTIAGNVFTMNASIKALLAVGDVIRIVHN